jgi:hypothetical protein
MTEISKDVSSQVNAPASKQAIIVTPKDITVIYAYEDAKSKGCRLAASKETIQDVERLDTAMSEKYNFAVDPKDLKDKVDLEGRAERWYQIIRESGGVELKLITKERSKELKADGCGDEVLRIDGSVADAIWDERPVLLRVRTTDHRYIAYLEVEDYKKGLCSARGAFVEEDRKSLAERAKERENE